MKTAIRALGWGEFTCWLALVHLVLATLRPVAFVVDLLAPRLRPLSPRAGYSEPWRTP